MVRIIVFFMLFAMAFPVTSQGIGKNKPKAMTYYDRDHFLIEGTTIPDSGKESPYDRLPVSYKEKVRPAVWQLSKSSAGISIRFLTNSTGIGVKWTLLNNNTMNHMADTGIKGIDLYFKNNDHWQFVNTARPSGLDNEYKLVNNMDGQMREYRMYMPLYDGVVSLEVGIDSTSFIKKPPAGNGKPIVFYGTSITQGGCASRPGMVHTNIISRELNIECINYGFSGNGKMEQPIGELISGIDARFYVIECVPNMTAEEVTERAIPLAEIIRKKQPTTPIIFVENPMYTFAVLDEDTRNLINEKNLALKKEYHKMIEQGYQNIYYISGEDALGTDQEGTVDGVHFTDLGFSRYADFLIKQFGELGLVSPK